MKLIQLTITTSIVLFFVSIQLIAAADWTFPAPKGATVEWVNNSTKLNGITMNGRRFTSPQSIEEIIDFYRDLWGKEIAETEYDTWKLITHKEDELLYTVQVKMPANGSGSTGLLGVSDIAESLKVENRVTLAKNFPKLHGSNIINDIEMDDPGKNGQTIYLTNNLSVASNVNYYKSYYEEKKWSLRVDKSIGFSAPHTLVFSKGKDLVNIVIHRKNGQTNVIANLVNKKLLSW